MFDIHVGQTLVRKDMQPTGSSTHGKLATMLHNQSISLISILNKINATALERIKKQW